ncbi:MAG: seryl-tRNA synthetase [Solirubrobacterales bacterium]|nr:seryl-tRNA synthetase [Solirubrobacterales bacterium]
MLDLKRIRDDPDAARKALERRGAADDLDELLRLDAKRRELLPEIEGGRAKQNEANDAIAEAKRSGADAEPVIAEMRQVAAKVKQQEAELKEVEAERDRLLAELPNYPHPDVPDGETDEDAKLIREVGDKPEFGFEALDHLELGERHNWINMEAAANLSGTRFAYILGDLAMLEFSLVRFAMETVRAEGFTPAIPPVLVREHALYGTGFFPGERETIYEVPKDELFLVGTSEVSLAGLHAGEKEILADELPLRYAGFSTCFRRESGAGGRDTRGIFRVHQFDKVEMYSFVVPGESDAEHERLLAIQEKILTALELPYRVVDIPVGDLGAPAARKFDCEAWIPSQQRYREVTSCSNTTDFQARRLNARFRPKAEAPPEYMHTLNGTAVAVGRTLIALLENGQREDGSVALPAALAQYGAPSAIPTT